MSPEDFKALYTAIRNDFNDINEQSLALDIDSYERLSLEQIKQQIELSHFFGMDEDGPYSEFLNKGLKSLRSGFYKLCSPPFYNQTIYPNTFSAFVYYFYPDSGCNKLIKYKANIGPMTNVHKVYKPLPETFSNLKEISLLKRFEEEKNNPGMDTDNYYTPKKNFFDGLYKNDKMFYVIESVYDPAFPDSNPKPKKVTWSFIDF